MPTLGEYTPETAPDSPPAPRPEPSVADLQARVRQLEQNIELILDHVNQERRPCKACGVMIWMIPTRQGRIMPVTYDGTSHFSNCPKADQFRRPR